MCSHMERSDADIRNTEGQYVATRTNYEHNGERYARKCQSTARVVYMPALNINP